MQSARGEPGRNGCHRPLEFFNLIVAPTANFAQWARTDTIDPNCCHAENRSFDPYRSG
jgi:hypothetical protein